MRSAMAFQVGVGVAVMVGAVSVATAASERRTWCSSPKASSPWGVANI